MNLLDPWRCVIASCLVNGGEGCWFGAWASAAYPPREIGRRVEKEGRGRMENRCVLRNGLQCLMRGARD